jgi:hypothetical protein
MHCRTPTKKYVIQKKEKISKTTFSKADGLGSFLHQHLYYHTRKFKNYRQQVVFEPKQNYNLCLWMVNQGCPIVKLHADNHSWRHIKRKIL